MEKSFCVHDLVAVWIAQGNAQYTELLKKCRLYSDESGQAFVVECPSPEILEQVAVMSEKIAQPVLLLTTPRIDLVYEGEIAYSFFPEDAIRYAKIMINDNNSLYLPDSAIIAQIMLAERPVSLIRMRDHKALLCNDKVESISAAKCNDWTGSDVSKFWFDNELQKFMSALDDHKFVREHAYRALKYNGEPRDFCVNASLVMFRGDLCRLVENLI